MEQRDPIETMTDAELDALRGAAAWYAKYNHAKIEESLDNRSAYAMVQRERYIALVSALRKLGFDMALPDALAADLRNAASSSGTMRSNPNGWSQSRRPRKKIPAWRS